MVYRKTSDKSVVLDDKKNTYDKSVTPAKVWCEVYKNSNSIISHHEL